jgi:hypothetical protein
MDRKEVKEAFFRAFEKFKRAKGVRNEELAAQAAEDGYWVAVRAMDFLLLKKGIKKSELPKTERGRRIMIYKYAPENLRRMFFALRDSLHITAFWDRDIKFEILEKDFKTLEEYIKEIIKEGNNKKLK